MAAILYLVAVDPLVNEFVQECITTSPFGRLSVMEALLCFGFEDWGCWRNYGYMELVNLMPRGDERGS